METKLRNIIRAQRITERAFDDVLAMVRAGATERGIADSIRRRAKVRGASGLAFDPIVAAGAGAAEPHHQPTERRLRAGDLVVIDLGCRYGGYCADMTRTVAIGRPDAEQRKAYRLVLRAQEASIRTVRAGITGRELDATARDVIARGGYGKRFVHSLGHGIGRKVHQRPRISPNRSDRLAAGDVIAVEPGIYVPRRFGIRIEDMVLVTPHGARNLTRTPKRLVVIQ
ncbi:MAG: aminopeptidase P family protein [bacterium]|nr:aminopeptidase P family protein [bacterium]